MKNFLKRVLVVLFLIVAELIVAILSQLIMTIFLAVIDLLKDNGVALFAMLFGYGASVIMFLLLPAIACSIGTAYVCEKIIPSKRGLRYFVFCIFCILLDLFNLLLSISNESINWGYLLMIAYFIALLVNGLSLVKENKKYNL